MSKASSLFPIGSKFGDFTVIGYNHDLSTERVHLKCDICGDERFGAFHNMKLRKDGYKHNNVCPPEKRYHISVGSIIGDMEVISIEPILTNSGDTLMFAICRCKKCGRIRKKPISNWFKDNSLNHASCGWREREIPLAFQMT